MSVDPEIPYYRITCDVDTLYELDNYNSDDQVLAVTDQVVPGAPAAPEALDSTGLMTVAQATDEERRDWAAAYARLRNAAEAATRELDAAAAVWEAARTAAEQKLRAAYADYAPTHEAIDGRLTAAETQREAIESAARAALRETARQNAGDGLGPRLWVVKQGDSYSPRKAPDMYVPVVHLATCITLRDKPGTPVRYAAVWDKLREGAPQARAGRKLPGTYLFTRLCGRCKPEASLREAGGDEFDVWLDKAESVQPPAPSLIALKRELEPNIPWANARAGRDGYHVVSADLYRTQGKVEPHELLLGWVKHTEDGRRRVAQDEPVRLAALRELLPPLGYAVRDLIELNLTVRGQAVGGEERVSRAAVAIRRMTAAERRAHAAAGAAR